MFFGIGDGDFGMLDAMVSILRKVRNIMIPPVVQEKIMQERAAGGGSYNRVSETCMPCMRNKTHP